MAIIRPGEEEDEDEDEDEQSRMRRVWFATGEEFEEFELARD